MTFCGPGFETCAVGVVADVGDHEVGKVAVLMGQSVEESIFAIDDFLCQFDGCVVSDSGL